PFKTDCEELLGRFQQVESVRYEEFAAIWRAMDFSSVFYGMITNYEKRPFTRLVFTTVYDYFLPPYSFQIRVGALYMFYGLYFTQLVWPKEKIWIALKDWMCVQNFLSDALTCQHLDVVYVYRKLVYEKAFFYTAMPIQVIVHGCSFPNQADKYLLSFMSSLFEYKFLLLFVCLQEITNVHSHYERIKEALQVSTSVSVTPVNLSVQLQQCALEFQQWKENTKVS
ncbi:small nuclear RNA activating complex, polypeptide 1a isoform X2, partial [Silurus asotus]